MTKKASKRKGKAKKRSSRGKDDISKDLKKLDPSVSMKKKTKKRVFFGVLILIGILVIYYGFTYQLKPFIGEDLFLSIEPESLNLNAYSSEKVNLFFEVSTNNKLVCKAQCSYALKDIGTGETIYAGDILLDPRDSIQHNETVEMPEFGSGQLLYQFKTVCSNIESVFCSTSGADTSRTALVTIKYAPSPEQEEKTGELKREIESDLRRLNELYSKFNSLEREVKAQPLLIKNFGNETDTVKEKVNDTVKFSNDIIRLWDLLRFPELSVELEIYEGTLGLLESDIDDIENEVLAGVLAHNQMVENVDSFLSDESVADQYRFGVLNSNMGVQEDVLEAVDALGTLIVYVSDYEYDLDTITDEVQILEGDFVEIRNDVVSEYEDFRTQVKGTVDLENFLLCKLRDDCSDLIIEDSFGVEKGCKAISDVSKKKYTAQKNFFNNYVNLSFADLQNESVKSMQQKAINARGIGNLVAHPDFQLRADYLRNMSIAAFYNQTVLSPVIVNETIRNLSEEDIEIGLVLGNTSNLTVQNGDCDILGNATDIFGNLTFNVTNITLNITIELVDIIDNKLKDHKPVCCVFGECEECCRQSECANDTASFPLIILHGHAFNKKTSPDYSLNSFLKIEESLEDDGFINAGFISAEVVMDPEKERILGLSGNPIFVTSTYYYDVYNDEGDYVKAPQKSESIETYSLRLKDTIEYVKFLTGRDKVNVLAHSMGGLVARRYMQIFGDDNVHKLIMIGTPNAGVVGSTESLCNVFGGEYECRDLAAGSIFMSKVNDPNLQPDDAQLFTVIGRGCDSGEDDWDGVVLVSSVEMDNAVNNYVDGTCSFLTPLHTKMLDISEYPKTYEYIQTALKE